MNLQTLRGYQGTRCSGVRVLYTSLEMQVKAGQRAAIKLAVASRGHQSAAKVYIFTYTLVCTSAIGARYIIIYFYISCRYTLSWRWKIYICMCIKNKPRRCNDRRKTTNLSSVQGIRARELRVPCVVLLYFLRLDTLLHVLPILCSSSRLHQWAYSRIFLHCCAQIYAVRVKICVKGSFAINHARDDPISTFDNSKYCTSPKLPAAPACISLLPGLCLYTNIHGASRVIRTCPIATIIIPPFRHRSTPAPWKSRKHLSETNRTWRFLLHDFDMPLRHTNVKISFPPLTTGSWPCAAYSVNKYDIFCSNIRHVCKGRKIASLALSIT